MSTAPTYYPIVRIVDAPSLSAGVLFDFYARGVPGRADRWPLADGFDLGVPTLPDDLDVDAVDPTYGTRTITWTQRITGTKAQAYALQTQIARRVLAASGWLMVKMSADAPVRWYAMHRPTPGALVFTYLDANAPDPVSPVSPVGPAGADRWAITMTIPADAFSLREPVQLGSWTVKNDPSGAPSTIPCTIALPPIKGDAPAPLQVRFTASIDTPGYQFLFSAHASSADHPPVWRDLGPSGDGATAGPDTSTNTGDPGAAIGYIGGSNRAVDFSTTPGMATRLRLSQTLTPGRWKALLRVGRSDNASRFAFRLGQLLGTDATADAGYAFAMPITTARAASTGTNQATWVDLGDFTFPPSLPPSTDPSTVTAYTAQLALQAARIAGTGTARLDGLLFVPLDLADTLDASSLYVYFPSRGAGQPSVIDADSGQHWALGPTGALVSVVPALVGGMPYATPGAANRLTVLQQVNGGNPVGGQDAPDQFAAATTVTISYQPRDLYLGNS